MRALAALALLGAACVTSIPGPESTLARARELARSAPASHGDLQLTCEPPDADVSVDRVARGRCSDFAPGQGALRLGEGMHEVEVKKNGYAPYVTYFEPSGARAQLQVTLRPLAAHQGAGP